MTSTRQKLQDNRQHQLAMLRGFLIYLLDTPHLCAPLISAMSRTNRERFLQMVKKINHMIDQEQMLQLEMLDTLGDTPLARRIADEQAGLSALLGQMSIKAKNGIDVEDYSA